MHPSRYVLLSTRELSPGKRPGAVPLIWMHSHAHKNMFMSVYVSSLAFTQAEMQVRYIHLFI